MFTPCHNFQVGQVIIEFIMVFVVHYLIRPEIPTDECLHNSTVLMLAHAFGIGFTLTPAPLSIASFLAAISADLGTTPGYSVQFR